MARVATAMLTVAMTMVSSAAVASPARGSGPTTTDSTTTRLPPGSVLYPSSERDPFMRGVSVVNARGTDRRFLPVGDSFDPNRGYLTDAEIDPTGAQMLLLVNTRLSLAAPGATSGTLLDGGDRGVTGVEWSPIVARLFFAVTAHRLFAVTVRANGSGAVWSPLDFHPPQGFVAIDANPSPDGSRLLVTVVNLRNQQNRRYFVVPTAGGAGTALAIPGGSAVQGMPAWGAEGSHILYVIRRGPDQTYPLDVVSIDAQNLSTTTVVARFDDRYLFLAGADNGEGRPLFMASTAGRDFDRRPVIGVVDEVAGTLTEEFRLKEADHDSFRPGDISVVPPVPVLRTN